MLFAEPNICEELRQSILKQYVLCNDKAEDNSCLSSLFSQSMVGRAVLSKSLNCINKPVQFAHKGSQILLRLFVDDGPCVKKTPFGPEKIAPVMG
jgi:hypothetical protein